jgi:hypothetical protein
MVRSAGEKAEGKRKKAEVIVFCSIDEYPSQLDAGEKVFLAQPNFFILPFAFLLLPSEKLSKKLMTLFKTPTHRYADPPIRFPCLAVLFSM